jgi:hypothetical protein
MKRNNSPKNFQDYLEYWNAWHCDWFKSTVPEKIKEWNVPDVFGDTENKTKTVEYFPEPFYLRLGKDAPHEFDAIYININPAAGGDKQLKSNHSSELIKDYKSYQEKMSTLLSLKPGPNKFFKHREVRTRELLDKEEKDNVNVLCADLVPWHTENQMDIQQYILQNSSNIIDYVIKPLTRISKNQISNEKLKGKIIIRGTSFRNILNLVIPQMITKSRLRQAKEKIKYYGVFDNENLLIEKFSSLLTVIEGFGCKYFIFTGGQGMTLPPLDKKCVAINSIEDVKTIKELLTEII